MKPRISPKRTVSCLATLAALAVALPARAVQYEVEIDIRSEQAIYDLYATGDISETTRDALIELYSDGVDLNSATRDELYSLPNLTYAQVDAILDFRKLKGSIADPIELVSAGALAPEELDKLLPFIVVYPVGAKIPLNGRARFLAYYGLQDGMGPPMFLTANVKGPFDLSAGLSVVTTRLVLGEVTFDPAKDALVATPARYGVAFPRFYLRWKTVGREVLAGTFFAGFGQRLTLDNTKRYSPDGLYTLESFRSDVEMVSTCRYATSGELDPSCAGDNAKREVTPDFTWPRSFRGVAGSATDLPLGDTLKLSIYGLASYQDLSVYQYELYDRLRCADPRADNDPACSGLTVYARQADPLLPAPRFQFVTLPAVFSELLAAGHATLKIAERTTLGLTGYGATTIQHLSGVQLETQEYSSYAFGGPFGAIGVDAAFKTGTFNVFAEVTRSFDSEPATDPQGRAGHGGGGFGVLERNVFTAKDHELELSLRWYDREFLNPYARGIAALDEFEGHSERNELGARFEYTGKLVGDLHLRSKLDFWVLPEDAEAPGTAGTANFFGQVRADYLGWRVVQFGGWVDYRNKDFRRGGFSECYADTEVVIAGTPVPCGGEWYAAAAQVTVKPLRTLSLTATFREIFLTNPRYADHFQQARRISGEVRYSPVEALFFRLGSRYLSEDVEDPAYQEDTLRSVFEFMFRPSRALRLGLQYELLSYLDQRQSTLDRLSRHEHRFRLELESRF